MNQILINKCKNNNFTNSDVKSLNRNKKSLKSKYYKILVFSIILTFIALCIYIIYEYKKFSKEQTSKKLISNYNIITLYSKTQTDYNDESEIINKTEPFIIGLIEIDKIKLIYPILSTINDELLKISPCRFARSITK